MAQEVQNFVGLGRMRRRPNKISENQVDREGGFGVFAAAIHSPKSMKKGGRKLNFGMIFLVVFRFLALGVVFIAFC